MSTGLISIKYRMKKNEDIDTIKPISTPKPGSYRYFVRGKNHKPQQVQLKQFQFFFNM